MRPAWQKAVVCLRAEFVVLVLAIGAGVIFFSSALHRAMAAPPSDASKQLAARIAELRKAGEPILPEDFNQPAVPDDQNAALLLRAAGDAIDVESDAWTTIDKQSVQLPLSDEQTRLIQQLLVEYAPALEQEALAQQKSGVDWQIKLESPVFKIALQDLNKQRRLSQLLRYAAILSHQNGQDRRTVEYARQVIFNSKTVDSQPFIIAHLVSLGINLQAVDAINEIVPDLKIGTASGGAPVEELRSLLADLLDEKSLRQGLVQGMRAERMAELDTFAALQNGQLVPADLNPTAPEKQLPEPTEDMLANDSLLLIDWMANLIDATKKAEDWPAFNSTAAAKADAQKLNASTNPYAAAMAPNLGRTVLTQFRCLTVRRLATAALAARWYATEHDGKLPAKLEDLVPKYLPAVPSDPFTSGKPLNYANNDHPRIYSVGEDGRDDGGKDEPHDKRPWGTPDIVVRLERE